MEITDPRPQPTFGEEIECIGAAEFSDGGGFIGYGAHVSDGGQVILQYNRR